MYISFVFHQKSANQVVKPMVNEELNGEENEDGVDDDDSEYTSSSQQSSVYED